MTSTLCSEIYEPETTNFILKNLSKGDNVVVCGAHQGYFACLISDVIGATGTVYAFEPENTNFALLTESTKDKANIKTFHCALGIKGCEAKLFINSDNDGGHALWDVSIHPMNEKTRENKKTQPTQVKTLDDVLEGVTALKLILLDAEGAEHSILKGGINTIVDLDVPYIICEINHDAMHNCGTSQIGLRSFLRAYGYNDYMLTDGRLEPAPPNKEMYIRDDTGREYVFNMLFKRD